MESKKSEFCFACNTKTQKYYQNLRKIVIKSTGTRLSNLIKKFLNEVGSKRQVNDVSDILCSDCLRKLLSYDQRVSLLNNSERELRDVFSKTELDLSNKPIEPDETEIMENETLPGDLISSGSLSMNNGKFIVNTPTVENIQPKDRVLRGSIPKAIESKRNNSINTTMIREIPKTVESWTVPYDLSSFPPYEKQTYSCEKCDSNFTNKMLYLVSSIFFR